MDVEGLNGPAHEQIDSWAIRLMGGTALAFVPILVELWAHVFDSITVFLLAELALGGFAGRKFGASALTGALVAFLIWVSLEVASKGRAFHGEDAVPSLIALAGAVIFAMSALVMRLIAKKRKID